MFSDTYNMDPEERLARLALYLGLNCNPAAFHRVLRHAGSAVTAFGGLDLSVLGVNLPTLLSGGLFEEARERLDQAERRKLDILIWGDDNYPLRLGEVPDPPPVLWCRGAIEAGDRLAVGLVGSRSASRGGLVAARRLAREGAAMGLSIVSGLAKGVDAQAHWGALEAGGRTLAVLGNGLDWNYPRENARLYEEIPRFGALISEFPPETRPLPINFPRRNRVIAGLSLAVVVVEAGERSGALITARLALELNREVMALPGPAGEAATRGGNALIKSGAALVESMAEVAAEIKPRLLEGLKPPPEPKEGLDIPPLPEEPAGPAPRAGGGAKAEKTPVAKPPAQRREPGEPQALQGLAEGSPEARLLKLLAAGPLDAESLGQAAGLGVAEVSLGLLNLELSGRVARLESGLYAII